MNRFEVLKTLQPDLHVGYGIYHWVVNEMLACQFDSESHSRLQTHLSKMLARKHACLKSK